MKKFHGHNHGLKLSVLLEEDSSEQIWCSVCELEVSGEAYSCVKRDCDFILHKSCSELPKKFRHKSDPEHTFSLISEPPEFSTYYNCNACGDHIQAFAFQCDAAGCDRRMHVKCALLPESVECKAHNHTLHLYYSDSKPNSDGCSFFLCDVCQGGVTEGYWTYYCKDCDFGTHLECADGGGEEDEDDLLAAEKFHGHNHGLKLTVLLEEDSGEKIFCSVCELEVELSGEAYSCGKRDCEFILHKSCFELPKTFQHKSDPEHTYSLISEPPQHSLYYNCNACGDLIRAFGFQCDECEHRMHVKCAFLPESVECKAHSHNLDLYYSTSKVHPDGYSFFSCDVCDGGVTQGYWTYYCKECDFGTHLECANGRGEEEENGGGEDEDEDKDEDDLPPELQLARARIRMEQQRINLEFQMRMSRQNAEFMNSLANSWKGLF
ncbi:hypothetical protein C2S52_004227 [Perilla frutescens var. hirtella]|nr:hypothetical protein C2S52_004227 [Perilla frutescens var. hirtella]